MKILILKDRQSAGGGIVNFIEAVFPHIKGEKRLVSIGRPAGYHPEGRSFLKITFLRLFSDYVKIITAIIKFSPDIVHVNTSLDEPRRSIIRDSISVLIAKLFRKKVIVFWHGWYWKNAEEFPFRGGNKGFPSRAYRLADAYIVLSESFKKDLERWGFEGPVYTASTAYDPGVIGESSEGGIPVILFLSAVNKAKGVSETVEAYRILKEEGVKCSLTVAGDGTYLEHIKRYVESRLIPDIKFLGHVEGEAKREAFSSSSILCFPSHDEAMPVVVLEAMASGLALVTSDVGAMKDILIDGVTGFLVHPVFDRIDSYRFDPKLLADKLKILAVDEGLRRKMGDHNRTYAADKFTPEKVAAYLNDIYKKVFQAC